MTVQPGTVTIIRGGRLLDARAHRADPGDILVTGDTITEIGPPGLAAPAGAVAIDARGMLLHPGLINAHTHGHGNLAKGMGDRWTLELLLTAAPWINGNRSAEDRHLSAKIGAVEMVLKGVHRGLRPAARATGTDARGRAVAGPRLCRGRHARGDRADGRRPHDVRSDPRPDGRAAARRYARTSPSYSRCRGRSASMGCARDCTAGRSIVSRSASRWRRPSRITARTSSSAAARPWPRSTASACTATWPSPRCRPSSGCSATARRSPRTSTAWARSGRTSPWPTACGSTTTT